MHTIHYLLVDVDGEFDKPNEYYESVVSSLFDEWGSTWFDWWTVGGRWDGAAAEALAIKRHLVETGAPGAKTVPSNTNIVPIMEYRDELKPLLEQIYKWQTDEVEDLRRRLIGGEVKPEDAAMWPLIKDPIDWAKRVNESNKEYSEGWNKILYAPLEEIHRARGYNMAGWTAEKLIKLVDGDWNPDSHYYDFVHQTAIPLALLDFSNGVDGLYENPQDLALIGVDFHY